MSGLVVREDRAIAPTDVPQNHVSGDGPRVVLVHGLLDRRTSFCGVVDALPGCSVLTYDRRGCGESHQLPAPTRGLPDHVADLLEILGEEPVTLVGHSFGGQVALAAAVARPRTVRSVGIFETASPWSSWWPEEHRRLIFSEPPRREPSASRRSTVDAGEGIVADAREARARVERATYEFDLASIRSLAEPPYDLTALACPLTIGWGAESLEAAVRGYHEYVSRTGASPYPIPGAGHMAHRTHPREFASFVTHCAAQGAA